MRGSQGCLDETHPGGKGGRGAAGGGRPGGASLPPWPVSLGASPSFDFFSVRAGGGSRAGGGHRPWESRSPPSTPTTPCSWGGANGWERGRGVARPCFCIALVPTEPQFPPDVERLGETEAGKGGGCPGGPRRGRRAMPYLGARRRCRLCCARDTGTCFDLRRRGGAGEQDLPWLPPAAAPAPAPPHAPRPPPHDGRRR